MNKSVIESLIKIADNLDNLGYLREASRLDKIAQTMAPPPVSYETQQNAYNSVGDNTPTNTPVNTAPVTPNDKTQSPGQYASTGDYVKDINRFKELLSSGNLNGANALKDSVISNYDLQKRNAFLSQANNIQDQFRHKYHKEDSYTDDQLYNLLNNYGINNAQDLKTLNLSWNKMMQYLKNKKLLTKNKEFILNQTYRNVAAKFGYSRFNSNITGNFNTDFDNYSRMIYNRLFTEASSLLSQVLNNDKYTPQQKEIFKLRADSSFDSLENQSNKDFYHGGISYDSMISDANYFGVYKARNIKEFNSAWNKLLNSYKAKKFDKDQKNPKAPTIYASPGVPYQLENFKKEIMIQQGFTKIPSS